MPELPEVETVMRGIEPYLVNSVINKVILRHHQLRWPIPADLPELLEQQRILYLTRRGKYLLIHVTNGTLMIHLGMSGSLRIVSAITPIKAHDHIDIMLSNDNTLRFNDPRRFGACLWTNHDPSCFPLLACLGVEPLQAEFTTSYLFEKARNKKVAIKSFIMNSHIVVGVGNIYAAEALFKAKIHPATPAGRLTRTQHQNLVEAIKSILQLAIQHGGTTIKDFKNSAGKPGYFTQELAVYGRADKPCLLCSTLLNPLLIGQRSTVFCPHCQPILK